MRELAAINNNDKETEQPASDDPPLLLSGQSTATSTVIRSTNDLTCSQIIKVVL